MKKLYIYVLIVISVFICFKSDVKAEMVCKYVGTKTSSGEVYTISVEHDSVNKFTIKNGVYSIKTTVCKTKISEDGSQNETVDNNCEVFPSNTTNIDTTFKGSFSDNTVECYKYAYASTGVGFRNFKVCLSDNKDDSSCLNKISNGISNIPISYSYKDKKKLKNLKDGDSCKFSGKYRDASGKEGFCNIKVDYKASRNGLDIYYDDTLNTNVSFVKLDDNDTRFRCGLPFDLRNVTIGTSNSKVTVSTRTDFERKFIEYWDSDEYYKNCSSLLTWDENSDPQKTVSVILPDAKEECVENGCKEIETTNFANLAEWTSKWHTWYDNDGNYNCDGLIGPKIKEIINDILMYIKILIPVLLIGLGVSDFVKAMFSSDEQAMAKAKNKFIRRLIMAAIVFMIPAITNLIFNSINGIWAHINNEACNIWK